MLRFSFAVLVTIAMGAAAHMPAYAHDHGQPAQYQEGTHDAHHGGDIQHIGEKHLELVLEGGKLVAYLTDEKNHAMSGQGAQVTGVVLMGGNQKAITFRHTGDNRLEADGDFTNASDLRAVLTVTLKGSEPQRARFHLKK